jgi:hypothetical protein
MDHYDPERSPEPSVWHEFDEATQINLVLKYHEDIEVELPNEKTLYSERMYVLSDIRKLSLVDWIVSVKISDMPYILSLQNLTPQIFR